MTCFKREAGPRSPSLRGLRFLAPVATGPHQPSPTHCSQHGEESDRCCPLRTRQVRSKQHTATHLPRPENMRRGPCCTDGKLRPRDAQCSLSCGRHSPHPLPRTIWPSSPRLCDGATSLSSPGPPCSMRVSTQALSLAVQAPPGGVSRASASSFSLPGTLRGSPIHSTRLHLWTSDEWADCSSTRPWFSQGWGPTGQGHLWGHRLPASCPRGHPPRLVTPPLWSPADAQTQACQSSLGEPQRPTPNPTPYPWAACHT